jgi:ribonuclease BN (tRNA processing enzyme)
MIPTTLTVIGSGDAFSAEGSGHTCFLLRSPSVTVALDFGATTLTGLKKLGYTSDDIDAIVLTHFHGDHFGGVPFLLLDAARLNRSKALSIVSPPGGEARISELFDLLYPGSAEALTRLDLRYIEFSGHNMLSVDGFELESFPVVHSQQTCPHGVRISIDGLIISYTGDTEWTDNIRKIVAEADLAICECTFFRKEEKNHLNYTKLLEEIRGFTCKRLLLTHFDQEMLDHLGEVSYEHATDGLVIQINDYPHET